MLIGYFYYFLKIALSKSWYDKKDTKLGQKDLSFVWKILSVMLLLNVLYYK